MFLVNIKQHYKSMIIGNESLVEWKREFFRVRELNYSSGNSLYTYKMTSEEFNSLEILFSNWIQNKTVYSSASSLVNIPLFNQLFVLYASEWWKRRYSGGPWSWDPILSDLKINTNDWSAPKRSECVEKGFKEWNLEIRNKTGKRFLGSVAIQGGLPMNLMAQNHGSVIRVLHRVLDLASGISIDVDLITSWIKSLSHYLPYTYQKDEIYDLLAEMVMVLSTIKSEVNSDDPAALIDEWRRNSNKWQKLFPVNVSDDKTSRIIENLIRKVAETKHKKVSAFISFERTFDFYGEDDQRLNIKINLEQFVSENSIRESFQIPNDVQLGTNLILEIQCGDEVSEIGLRKIIGNDRFKLTDSVIGGFTGYNAIEKTSFLLRDRQGNKWLSDIVVEKLEPDQPWIFQSLKDEASLFINQGSCNVSSSNFITLLHKDIEFDSAVTPTHHGVIFEDYKIIEFNSDTIFRNQSNELFRVKTKFSGETQEILMQGVSLSSIFEKPVNSFRGKPSIYELKESGLRKSAQYKWGMGGKTFIASSDIIRGPVYASIEDDGYTRWKKKMVVLPEDSREEIIRGLDVTSGTWRFENWDIEKLETLTPNIISKKTSNDQWVFTYVGVEKLPEHIVANVYWSNNSSSARIKIPFPAQGIRVFNKNSELISDGSLLSITKINGIRINVIPGEAKVVKMEIKSDGVSIPLEYLKFEEDEYSKQIRLSDFNAEIEKILSLSEELDDVVYFNIYFEDKKVFHLKISRYSFRLEQIDNIWYLPSEIVSKISDEEQYFNLNIKTQRLDIPGIADLNVVYRETGELIIPDEMKSNGPWIIYSSKDSDFLMRPTLLTIFDGEDDISTNDDGLKSAINVSNKTERLKAIDKILAEMTDNPDHNDWDTIARLAYEYSHLPLSAIDVWTRAILNHDFMAMLVIGKVNLGNGFMDRFAYELPFMFEFIPIRSFEKALNQDKLTLVMGLDEDDIYELLLRKCTVSEWAFESFKYSYRIALTNILGPVDKEINVGNSSMVEFMMFSGPDSFYQKLRQIHELNNENWLSFDDLFEVIKEANRTTKNLFKFNEQYRKVIINTPILLAKWAFKGDVELANLNPVFVMMYRKVKDFDEHWFVNAFNFSLLKQYYENR